jgi:hypothetical protein
MLRLFGYSVIVLAWLVIITATVQSDHTFEEFELREQLQMLQINLWELLHQNTYVDDAVRPVVHEEIRVILDGISATVSDLLEAYEKNQPHVPPPAL